MNCLASIYETQLKRVVGAVVRNMLHTCACTCEAHYYTCAAVRRRVVEMCAESVLCELALRQMTTTTTTVCKTGFLCARTRIQRCVAVVIIVGGRMVFVCARRGYAATVYV